MARFCAPLLLCLALSSAAFAADAPKARSAKSVASHPPAYPLKLSANHRYLVDAKNHPFLIVGDTPQGLMYRLSEAEADFYFADRQANGFNTLGWIDVACSGQDYPANTEGRTYDGIPPFDGFLAGGKDVAHYDLAKPNEAYFTRLDHMVQLAGKHGLFVFLDPLETIGWLGTLRNNGEAAANQYGRFLGRRYRKYANVGWLSGNDFQTWKTAADDAVVQAVAKGIRAEAPKQIQTVELNYNTSSSFDDSSWIPLTELNGTYTYSPTYIQMLHGYHQQPAGPTFLMEGHYDLEDVGDPKDLGTPAVLRRQAYWTMLSGGTGQFYGNSYTWSFKQGWQQNLDTPGVAQQSIWKAFFTALPWHALVPDEDHLLFTAGMGSYGDSTIRVSQSDYATAAATPDRSLVVVYLPTARKVTIAMSKLKGTMEARWFDPTDGDFLKIAGSPFAAAGSHDFEPPAKNHDGTTDWVLVLTSAVPR